MPDPKPQPCVSVYHNEPSCQCADPHHTRLALWCLPCLIVATSAEEPF